MAEELLEDGNLSLTCTGALLAGGAQLCVSAKLLVNAGFRGQGLRMSTSDTEQYQLARAEPAVPASPADAWDLGVSPIQQKLTLEWCGTREGWAGWQWQVKQGEGGGIEEDHPADCPQGWLPGCWWTHVPGMSERISALHAPDVSLSSWGSALRGGGPHFPVGRQAICSFSRLSHSPIGEPAWSCSRSAYCVRRARLSACSSAPSLLVPCSAPERLCMDQPWLPRLLGLSLDSSYRSPNRALGAGGKWGFCSLSSLSGGSMGLTDQRPQPLPPLSLCQFPGAAGQKSPPTGGLNNAGVWPPSSGGQKSEMSLTGKKRRCRQGCAPSGGPRAEFVPHSLLPPRPPATRVQVTLLQCPDVLSAPVPPPAPCVDPVIPLGPPDNAGLSPRRKVMLAKSLCLGKQHLERSREEDTDLFGGPSICWPPLISGFC